MSGLLVTGGSGSIGSALSRAAASCGHRVVIGYDRGEARAAAVRADINSTGGEAEILRLPLHDLSALAAGLGGIAPADAPRTIALCGWPQPNVAPFARQSSEDFASQHAALTGCHALIATAWRLWWRKGGGGHVIAVLTSALGPPAAPHMASYVAGKGGLRSLLDAAAAELGSAGLRVSTVSPGYVETEMLRAFDPRLLERARARTPGGAFLTPDAVAAVLLESIEEPPCAGSVRELEVQS